MFFVSSQTLNHTYTDIFIYTLHMHIHTHTHTHEHTMHAHILSAITYRCSCRHTHRSCLRCDDISLSVGLVARALRTPDANWKQEAGVSTEVSKSCHSEYVSSKIQSSMLPDHSFLLPHCHNSKC